MLLLLLPLLLAVVYSKALLPLLLLLQPWRRASRPVGYAAMCAAGVCNRRAVAGQLLPPATRRRSPTLLHRPLLPVLLLVLLLVVPVLVGVCLHALPAAVRTAAPRVPSPHARLGGARAAGKGRRRMARRAGEARGVHRRRRLHRNAVRLPAAPGQVVSGLWAVHG